MKKNFTTFLFIAVAVIGMFLAKTSQGQIVHLYLDSVQDWSVNQFCKTSVDTVIVHKPAGVTMQYWNCAIPPYNFYEDTLIIPNIFNSYSISGGFTCYFIGGNKTIYIRFADSLQVPGLQDQILCGTTPITLDTTSINNTQYPTYLWNTGDSMQTITVNTTGIYAVQISNACNMVYDTANIIFVAVDPKLCAATFDPATQKNKLVWDGNNLQAQDVYILKRNLSNYLAVIDTVVFATGEWIDYASNPQIEQNGYAMMVLDTCGNVSDTSAEHTTVWLQISQYMSDVYFTYTPYQGAPVSTYTLFGIDNLSNVDSITSRPAAFLNMLLPDSVASLYQKFFIGFPITCGGAKSIITIKSNIVDGLTGIQEQNLTDLIHVYPTLTTGRVNITTDLTIMDIKVYTTLGQVLLTTKDKYIDIPYSGLYFLYIQTTKGVMVKKIIVQ